MITIREVTSIDRRRGKIMERRLFVADVLFNNRHGRYESPHWHPRFKQRRAWALSILNMRIEYDVRHAIFAAKPT